MKESVKESLEELESTAATSKTPSEFFQNVKKTEFYENVKKNLVRMTSFCTASINRCFSTSECVLRYLRLNLWWFDTFKNFLVIDDTSVVVSSPP